MISDSAISRTLDRVLQNGADFAEIFIEDRFDCAMALSDSRIKQAIGGRNYGIGIRAFFGLNERYAYVSSDDERMLLQAAGSLTSAEPRMEKLKLPPLVPEVAAQGHTVVLTPFDIDKQERADILMRADAIARKVGGPYLSQFDSGIHESVQDVRICNSDGLDIADRRAYVRFRLTAIAASGSEKQTASHAPGTYGGFEFIRTLPYEALVTDAVETAVKMLKASFAPAGTFPVIIDNGFGGVIFHEACGHALETTAVAKNASVFADKLGMQIAHPALTAVDDGTMANEWGSLNIDDEGMPTQRTVLIENGILKSFLADRLGALRTGQPRTGSARRESYRYAPTSRMRNTFIAPGPYSLDDLIGSVDDGIYARRMGGGSVNPATGDFNFAVMEGYRIRNGRIAEPLRGATLIGNGADVLRKISMCASNFEMAQGMCGSVSGQVPTNVGQGAVKVDQMIVGGR